MTAFRRFAAWVEREPTGAELWLRGALAFLGFAAVCAVPVALYLAGGRILAAAPALVGTALLALLYGVAAVLGAAYLAQSERQPRRAFAVWLLVFALIAAALLFMLPAVSDGLGRTIDRGDF